MPSCLGASGFGAGHEDAPVAVAPAAAPHLLAVDDEAVAVALGPRGQPAEVAARARLAEQLAPHVLGAQRRARGACACCSGVPNCSSAPPVSTRPTMLNTRRDAGERALVLPRRVVLGGQPAAAVLGRPVDAGVAGGVDRAAARRCPCVDEVGRADRAVVAWRVRPGCAASHSRAPAWNSSTVIGASRSNVAARSGHLKNGRNIAVSSPRLFGTP